MSQEQAQRVVYDCDTSGYWCSEEDNQNAQKRYGAFIDNGTAYEIIDRHTPRPWLNYLCNDRFGSVVSNDGLGFTFYKTTLIRITKYDHPVDYLPGNSGMAARFSLKTRPRVKSGTFLKTPPISNACIGRV